MQIQNSEELKCMMTCTFILCVKMYITNMIQLTKSVRADQRVKEDKNFFEPILGKPEKDTQQCLDDDRRWKRVVMNDLECIPIQLFVFYVAFLTLRTDTMKSIFFVTMVTFTIGRMFHSICYAFQLMPHRAICYNLAQFSAFTVGVSGLVEVYSA